jgi:hypothetical protein
MYVARVVSLRYGTGFLDAYEDKKMITDYVHAPGGFVAVAMWLTGLMGVMSIVVIVVNLLVLTIAKHHVFS